VGPTISVQIVTFNSESDIGPCLASLSRQTRSDFRVRILDNASSDLTRDRLELADADILLADSNTGFAAAHNRLARQWPASLVLFLNPDTVLDPRFLEELASALERNPEAGSATGKLLRMDGMTLDSTGIVMTRNQRHLDRGAGEADLGQFDAPGEIFGPSGAAALYRYACLEDVAIAGQFFDEDFFAYREDADLAWRSRLRGWTSLYVPLAVARHRRRVTPERRSALPAMINRHSVKNRFLLRINNMTGALYRRDFWPVTRRDLQVVGYVMIREWSSIPGLLYPLLHLRRLLGKRRQVQSRIRVGDEAIGRWFEDPPAGG
jgi:GT2 family glycosyltransferase